MRKPVLIIEDDSAIQQALQEVLEMEGYKVAVADNGKQALDYLRSHKVPSLILLDLMMPVMNGWEFTEELKRDPEFSAYPLIIMSADSHVGEKAADLHATGHLRKPIDLSDLLHVVETHSGAL